MKNKEKQIEEMAKVMRNDICHNLNCANCNSSRCYTDGKCHEYHCAKILLEHYQPKIPKDSVVLSGLELADYKHYKEYTKSLAMIEKETAENCNSILERNYKDWLKVLNDLNIDTSNKNILVSIVCGLFKNSQEDIAKQFGVEIKE